jgi:hypothetical protein
VPPAPFGCAGFAVDDDCGVVGASSALGVPGVAGGEAGGGCAYGASWDICGAPPGDPA